MTDATGRSFLSYRRVRAGDAALLVAAQHERGIPTWQDVKNLAAAPTEDEIRRVLADPRTANGILLITPEVEDSPIIRKVEVPGLLKRATTEDEFFLVPLAAGGLDYDAAAAAVGNEMSVHDLGNWNMQKVHGSALDHEGASTVARRVLDHRLGAVHRQLAAGEPLRVGLFARKAPPFVPGVALSLDWTHRFEGKVASADAWRAHLVPALHDVVDAILRQAPGRPVEAFGLPTLPAAVALGCAFLSTVGASAAWKQLTPGQGEQLWSLDIPREPSGFRADFVSQDAGARDLAVLVSVADDTEPLFAAARRQLPPLRAVVHVKKPGGCRHHIDSPGQATDVALTVQQGLRDARQTYGDLGTVHLFIAAPVGLAFLVGQLMNTFGAIQTYEHVTSDGSGHYEAAALLEPSR